MGVTVRVARMDDVPWMVSQLPALDAIFQPCSLLPATPGAAAERLAAWIQSPAHAVWIAERQDVPHRPVGFLAAVLAPHPFNDVPTLCGLLLWVVPDARFSKATTLLLRAFCALGEAHAAMVIFARNVQTPLRSESLARLGFRHAEELYVYTPNAPDTLHAGVQETA
jgi:hypothetical protein